MIPIFKIHASQISKIVGGAMSKPTEKQMQLLAELQAKYKRTAKQDETVADLIAKRDAPPALQDGAKTYCKQWLKEQTDLYARKKRFANSKTEKGERCEVEGIRMTAQRMGYGEVFKNENQYENDWIIGTPDLPLKNIIEDIKCSWDEQSFPLFETELPTDAYWWQGQGYMDLLPPKKFAVAYCLIDTPTDIIERAAFYRAKDLGMDEVPMDLYDEVHNEMTYANVPDYLKYRRFEFDKDGAAIQAIHAYVELCRTYITGTLIPQLDKLKQTLEA